LGAQNQAGEGGPRIYRLAETNGTLFDLQAQNGLR
jgi:hypothetical protein